MTLDQPLGVLYACLALLLFPAKDCDGRAYGFVAMVARCSSQPFQAPYRLTGFLKIAGLEFVRLREAEIGQFRIPLGMV